MSQTDAVKELIKAAKKASQHCRDVSWFGIYEPLDAAIAAVEREQETTVCPRCHHPLDRHKDDCKYIGDCSGEECGCTYLVKQSKPTEFQAPLEKGWLKTVLADVRKEVDGWDKHKREETTVIVHESDDPTPRPYHGPFKPKDAPPIIRTDPDSEEGN